MAAFEHLEINTATAGRAGFKLDVREAFAQHIQQTVKLMRLCRQRRAAFVTGLNDFAVHVPFHVIHIVLAEQPAHALHQVIKDLRIIQIEHELMTPAWLLITGQCQQPVGMGAI